MNTIKSTPHNLIALKRHTLLVTLICYIPHIVTQPLWLFIILVASMGYRLCADYFNFQAMPRWVSFILVIGCLILLNQDIQSHGFVIRFLLTFIILKCLEFHTLRDVKVFIFCNFLLIFAALIVIQELWIIVYLFIAILANLSLMLKLNTSEITLRQIIGKSSQQLLLAIPLGILLFYIFPRINPLWHVPSLSKSSTGFNERMSFGSIAELYNDDSLVMQITFKKNPTSNAYWRGTVLNFYTGESWIPTINSYLNFSRLPELKANEIADYEILLEPHQTKWLFYEGYPAAGRPRLFFLPDHGLIRQNGEAIVQPFAYAVSVKSPPYQMLNTVEYAEAIQLPRNINPRLNAWAKENFARTNKDIKGFITFLKDYIHQQPFWYTLTPPTLNRDRNQMDNFWFGTHKGFCEHYASAFTFILRAAGIPARVVLGYLGGELNPMTHAITIHQNDAHAWIEYWQKDIGWQQLDPTLFIASERIDKTIRNREDASLNLDEYFNISKLPWLQKIKFFLESIQFYSKRWFLFYNQNTQQNLLQNIGLGHWNKAQIFQASIGCIIVFFILLGFYYQWQQKKVLDNLLFEYYLLQKEFRRFNFAIPLSATLRQQCKLLIDKVPDLAPLLSLFIYRYEELRLKQSENDSKENKKETIALFKTLRHTLRQHQLSKFLANQVKFINKK